MIKAFPHLGTSELFKHELVYALGQLSPEYYPTIKEFLINLVKDESQMKLARH